MDLTRYVDDLQRRLAQAADLGDEETRELARRLATPLDAAVRLMLLDALSGAAGEISADLAPGSVDVRLRGGDPEFVVTLPETAQPETTLTAPTAAPDAPAPPPRDADDAATTRTTLRLPDHLKAQVEAAASAEGVSVNTWLVRAVATALAPSPAAPPRSRRAAGGTHLTGWVR